MVKDSAEKATICASIGAETIPEAINKASKVADSVDVIEIRLDLLEAPEIEPFCTALKVPLLFTCRAGWEGGGFDGKENDRIALLEEAVRCKAAYVDLELHAPADSWKRLRQAVQDAPTQLICSWHNFKTTPADSELVDVLSAMGEIGADIGKIVTTAEGHLDVLRVLNLQQYAARMKLPLVAFCMGKAGMIGRIVSPFLGGYMTYCSPEPGEATAPGQIGVNEMREIYKLFPG